MSVTVLNICHIYHQSCEVKRFSYEKIFTSQLNIRPTSKIYIFISYLTKTIWQDINIYLLHIYIVGFVASVSDRENLLKISIFQPI